MHVFICMFYFLLYFNPIVFKFYWCLVAKQSFIHSSLMYCWKIITWSCKHSYFIMYNNAT